MKGDYWAVEGGRGAYARTVGVAFQVDRLGSSDDGFRFAFQARDNTERGCYS